MRIRAALIIGLVAAALQPAAALTLSEPMALRGYPDPTRHAFTLVWEPVKDAAGYNVYRRRSLRGPSEKINTYTLPIVVFADRTEGGTYFYTVRALNADGIESNDSLIIDSSPETRIHFLASDGVTTASMPGAAAAALQPEKNEWKVPLTLAMTEEPADGRGGVVRSLRFRIVRGDTRATVEGPSLAACAASMNIGYNALNGQVAIGAPTTSVAPNAVVPGSSPERLMVYWHNGVTWIKMGAAKNKEGGALQLASSQLGRYQIRLVDPAQAIALERSNVFPSLFTPNGDGHNDRLFFMVDNPNASSLTGEIRDLSGRLVTQLIPGQTLGLGATFVWDGRDTNGSTASSGLYIYRLTGDGTEITGTVAVAR